MIYSNYNLITMQESEDRLMTILNTEEKAIDYAQTQINDNSLMAAKSILDQTLKKLESNMFATSDQGVLAQRTRLIQRINNLFEEIAKIRKSKSKKKLEDNHNDVLNPQDILVRH